MADNESVPRRGRRVTIDLTPAAAEEIARLATGLDYRLDQSLGKSGVMQG